MNKPKQGNKSETRPTKVPGGDELKEPGPHKRVSTDRLGKQ